jgi:hypothetical protein
MLSGAMQLFMRRKIARESSGEMRDDAKASVTGRTVGGGSEQSQAERP